MMSRTKKKKFKVLLSINHGEPINYLLECFQLKSLASTITEH